MADDPSLVDFSSPGFDATLALMLSLETPRSVRPLDNVAKCKKLVPPVKSSVELLAISTAVVAKKEPVPEPPKDEPKALQNISGARIFSVHSLFQRLTEPFDRVI